jgi:hypothetical protein
MDITGNKATAYGFIAAAEKAGLKLYLGSYPITPATDVLHELSKHKSLGVMTVQCEDEISGCASAVGASFAGALAVTSTSGPGICLKSEAMNLAVIMELPLVVLDVQRGGPATGLPTKSEQTDLLQVLFGRNGESPMPVLAAPAPSEPADVATAEPVATEPTGNTEQGADSASASAAEAPAPEASAAVAAAPAAAASAPPPSPVADGSGVDITPPGGTPGQGTSTAAPPVRLPAPIKPCNLFSSSRRRSIDCLNLHPTAVRSKTRSGVATAPIAVT